jgi:WS/DGAT/MGAT family acyltransferase
MQQLSPQDAQFLYGETAHNLTHVTSIGIYDPSTVPGGGPVRFKDIIEHIRERLDYNPLLRRRLLRLPLEIDYPYWVEDEFFDLEYHIQHGRLPVPGDWRQFCIHMARYHSRPLDMNRPPWEIFVVEGLDNIDDLPSGCYAVVTKIHHAAVDGTSFMKFFASLADADSLGTPLVPLEVPDEEPAELPPMTTLLRRAVRSNLGSPVRIAETLMRAAPSIYQAAQDAASRRDRHEPRESVPHTRFNVELSPHKMFDAREYPLDQLKEIRELHVGVTINDVVLAICSGALRRYLQHHGELPAESLVAWVPINARPKGADGGDIPGNNITAMTALIHTEEPDALQRLKKINRATRASKEARSGISARLMTDITQHVPAATQIMAARLLLSRGVAAKMCNLFVSNVPGPQIPTYMNGARLVRSCGLAPLADGMGLFIATPSYDGRISFNVISTREVMPDIEFFMECLNDALGELLTLARSGGKPAPARRRRPAKKPARKTAARKTAVKKTAAKKSASGKRARKTAAKAAPKSAATKAARSPAKKAAGKARPKAAASRRRSAAGA